MNTKGQVLFFEAVRVWMKKWKDRNIPFLCPRRLMHGEKRFSIIPHQKAEPFF